MIAGKDRSRFLMMLAIPFAALAASFFAAQLINFSPPVSSREQGLIALPEEGVLLPFRAPEQAASLPNLFRGEGADGKEYPGTPLAALAPAGVNAEPALSFILINNTRRLAILNGKVVTEGESVDGARVMRIEKKRVLLKSKGGQEWLALE